MSKLARSVTEIGRFQGRRHARWPGPGRESLPGPDTGEPAGGCSFRTGPVFLPRPGRRPDGFLRPWKSQRSRTAGFFPSLVRAVGECYFGMGFIESTARGERSWAKGNIIAGFAKSGRPSGKGRLSPSAVTGKWNPCLSARPCLIPSRQGIMPKMSPAPTGPGRKGNSAAQEKRRRAKVFRLRRRSSKAA